MNINFPLLCGRVAAWKEVSHQPETPRLGPNSVAVLDAVYGDVSLLVRWLKLEDFLLQDRLTRAVHPRVLQENIHVFEYQANKWSNCLTGLQYWTCGKFGIFTDSFLGIYSTYRLRRHLFNMKIGRYKIRFEKSRLLDKNMPSINEGD